MDTTDFRVLAFNSATMALSFSQLEEILKIILLLASIGYTIQRSYLLRKYKK
jgi:hypothetical protein